MKKPGNLEELKKNYRPTITRSFFFSEDRSNRFYCRALVFTNRGDTPVFIDGYELAEDETLSIDQFANDLDVTAYQIRFGTLVTTKRLEVKVTYPTSWPE